MSTVPLTKNKNLDLYSKHALQEKLSRIVGWSDLINFF